MSKVAPTKKKASSRSSTDSSSASSSDSSSSSSSSSGSDSSSSSDSDSSSSQASAKNSSTEQQQQHQKKAAPIKNAATRKSTETKTPPSNKPKPKQAPVSKVQKTPPKAAAPPTNYSSDDESHKGNKPKKKPPPKPVKATAPANIKNPPKVSGGGKVPPKANPAAKVQQAKQKENAKTKVLQKTAKLDASKKKSIFSPENSSESDANEKPVAKTQALKATAIKPRAKASAKPIEPKPKPPGKRDAKLPKSKEIISSASSTASSSDSSSSSDSDSSDSASDKSNKKSTPKKSGKKTSTTPKETQGNSDSETESKQTTRKSTRSSNTRKSKHVLGKNVFSDTDSESESTKRSLSRSPVKKAPVATKGKAKNKKAETSKKVEVIIAEDRKCPLEECNSNGHLCGKLEKHFTIDACPLYHNLTASKCNDNLQERRKREETRKKLADGVKKSPRGVGLNSDQKNYMQKIKDSRSNFKVENDEGKILMDKNIEPNLETFVPEYDLKLFRDAQAISSEKVEEELKTLPNTKGTKYIEMGKFEMEVWYQSPYPEEYARLPKLYICEYCLRYMRGRIVLQRHAAKCVWRHPPGEEVYRKDKISVWEVDGKRYKQYCQNLCLLAKFFLDHKTLYFDVEPFLFYVMTMSDQEGCHTVGYFSKEKNSFLNYNVSCILTLPPYQRQGYGRLLIDFSYLLTRVEGKIGSPEKPLSDLGLISYRSYWKDVLLSYLCARAGTQLSIKDMSQEMAIHSTDIVSTLQALGMMKYWKGKHIILKKQDVLDEYAERVKRRGSLLKEVDKSCLRWTPFVPPQPNPS